MVPGLEKQGNCMIKVIGPVDVCQRASTLQKVDLDYKKLFKPNMLQ
jgi:hypothetical protein